MNCLARPSFRPSAALGAIGGIKLWVFVLALPVAFPFLAQAATEVEPSAAKPLAPGQKIAGYKALRFERPYIVQRLTERTYWVAVETNNLIFHVGDRGVLVFDPHVRSARGNCHSGDCDGDGPAGHRTGLFA